jgi:hypothetical protein
VVRNGKAVSFVIVVARVGCVLTHLVVFSSGNARIFMEASLALNGCVRTHPTVCTQRRERSCDVELRSLVCVGRDLSLYSKSAGAGERFA